MSPNGAAQAFIAFLRCEAQQAEDRAKSLRATAAAIEANNLEGRKRKRQRQNTAHSAYSLFVHENFDLIKKDHADLPSREIISMLARQWAGTADEEKQIWKFRAEQSRNEPFPTIPGLMPDVPEMEEDSLDEEDDIDDDVDVAKQRTPRRETNAPSAAV